MKQHAINSQLTDSPANTVVEPRQWRALQVFNSYRILISIIILIYNYWGIGNATATQRYPELFYFASCSYIVFAIALFIVTYKRWFNFQRLAFNQGLIDLIILTALLYTSYGANSNLAILINISIAGISLLLPGRIPLFFAAVATVLLLLEQSFAILFSHAVATNYFQGGIQGLSFFATAIIAHVLSMRVRASEALASQREVDLANLQRLSEYIIQRQHAGVIVVDSHWRIRLINQAARKMFVAHGAKKLNHISELSAALSNLLSEWRNKSLTKLRPLKTTMTNPDLIVNFTPLVGGKDAVTIISLEDMTLIIQEAHQLKLASLGRFTASIAHELRNPLGAISHAAQLLLESPDLDHSDHRLTEIIYEQSERMNTVIKNILQISRRKKTDPKEIVLQPWLQNFIIEFTTIGDSNILFKMDVQPENLTVFTDGDHLQQILTVLCENSIRHCKKNENEKIKIVIAGKMILDTAEPYIEVIDNGPGISEDIAAHIFEPFYTTDRSGTGLGLYIAKELCEASRGTLLYLPTEAGACFRITYTQNGLVLG